MSRYSKCPKCKFTAKSSFSECPRCGVIVSKFMQIAKADKQADRQNAASKNADLQNLAHANTVVIRQQKEWGEILTGFETKNRYDVMDLQSNPLIEALEEGGCVAKIGNGRLAAYAGSGNQGAGIVSPAVGLKAATQGPSRRSASR